VDSGFAMIAAKSILEKAAKSGFRAAGGVNNVVRLAVS
jgi:hypothetical protein